MPVRFTVDPVARIATVSSSGRPTAAEFAAALDGVIAHPGFARGFGVLNDRRFAETPEPVYLADCLLALATRAGKLAPCRWAIVARLAASAPLIQLVAVPVAMYGMQLRAFEHPADAVDWLRVLRSSGGP